VDLRGGDSTYVEADALKELYGNRDMLVAVATEAKKTLSIPDEAGPFCVTQDSLRESFRAAGTPSPVQNAVRGTETPAPQPTPRAAKKRR
jgi:hypothetical protein